VLPPEQIVLSALGAITNKLGDILTHLNDLHTEPQWK
jgi:hypothetical protein